MDRLIYYNDRIVEAAEAGISPTSPGLLYGWGVFTTLRFYRRAVFAFDRHWERLKRHSEHCSINILQEQDEVKRRIDELIEANSAENGRVRITVLKGEAGPWRLDHGRESDLLIFTAAEAPTPFRESAITISPFRVLSHGRLAGVKRTAMLENLLALEEARSRGFSEAVMVNERGEMVGATAANLFWVEGGHLFTPSRATGCVAGITRGFVCEIARQNKTQVVEGSFPVQRLLDAAEVFLSSTARGISPVLSFDIREYNLKQARKTKLIAREFQKLTRGARIKT
jgi:branched-subunit amino acid aminotransferase/4-amino-4-deoxychorismate lyase